MEAQLSPLWKGGDADQELPRAARSFLGGQLGSRLLSGPQEEP